MKHTLHRLFIKCFLVTWVFVVFQAPKLTSQEMADIGKNVQELLFRQPEAQFKQNWNKVSVVERKKTALGTNVIRPIKIITGRVTDANGEPLVGATVAVKGGGRGTVTDEIGRAHV